MIYGGQEVEETSRTQDEKESRQSQSDWEPMRSYLHSISFWAGVLALSVCAALLVTPITGTPEDTIFTRNNSNADPIHLAATISHGTDSLLTNPFGYYSPPFLYPDPNSTRSADTYLSESILALVLRFIVGDRPLLIVALARIVTAILSAVCTTLLLREFGVRRSLALAGGMLSILILTYGASIDRIQSMSNQWIALAVFFTARIYKGKKTFWNAAGLGASLFLLVHASIYTSVMLCSIAPFFVPVLFTCRRAPQSLCKTGIVAVTVLITAVLTAISMWPWLTDRWDMGIYAQPEFLEIKRWHSAYLGPLAFTPPEIKTFGIPFMPATRFDGYYPGHAVVLAIVLIAAFSLITVFRKADEPKHKPLSNVNDKSLKKRLFIIACVLKYVLGAVLIAVMLARLLGITVFQMQGPAVDVLIWGLLISWMLQLGLWDNPWRGTASSLSFLACAFFLAATVLFLLSFGSPIKLFINGPDIAAGIFNFNSLIFPPLGQLRFLYRITAFAGWFLFVGLALRLELSMRSFHKRLPVLMALLLIFTATAGWLDSNFGTIYDRKMPDGYKLLDNSEGEGGLLELPMTRWNSDKAMFRMLWQRQHKRPIVDGLTSQAPPWYLHANEVFNTFPSLECLWLMNKWNIDSALIEEPFEGWRNRMLQTEKYLIPRGEIEGWVLFDIEQAEDSGLTEIDGLAESLVWIVPQTAAGQQEQDLLSDGSTFYLRGIRMEAARALTFEIDKGQLLRAVMIDYGYAFAAHIPSRIEIQAFLGGHWRDVVSRRSGRFLRARAADLLMRRKPAKLVMTIKPTEASKFRIAAKRDVWHIPELRISLDRSN